MGMYLGSARPVYIPPYILWINRRGKFELIREGRRPSARFRVGRSCFWGSQSIPTQTGRCHCKTHNGNHGSGIHCVGRAIALRHLQIFKCHPVSATIKKESFSGSRQLCCKPKANINQIVEFCYWTFPI